MSKSDRDLPDLPWVMAKLRGLLDDYERARADETNDWHVVVEATYLHQGTGRGFTLFVGTESVGEEDDDDDDDDE